jgi:teichuronic acid biosynthesis glycosyltransferase TuaC
MVTTAWPEPPNRPVYGAAVRREAEAIGDLGVRLDVVFLRGYATPLAYATAAVWFALSSLWWRRRYRLIHVQTGEAGLATRFHIGTPMLITYAGDDLLGDRDKTGALRSGARLRAAIIRVHSRLFNATITQTQGMEDALPVPRRAANHVIPTGVRADVFRPLNKAAARRELGWGGEPVALFAATKPRSPAKRLWLAQAVAEAAGVRLEVPENLDPTLMPLLMSASDCLLVTSAVEGSPNAVKEALLCNLPVVTTAVGDIRQRLVGVEPSWICEPDEVAMVDAVRSCVELGMRSNGRTIAEPQIDQRYVAGRIVDVYKGVWR